MTSLTDMHMQVPPTHPCSQWRGYSIPLRSIWLAAISITLMMKAMAKAQIRLLRTHVCRFFFVGWTRANKGEREKLSLKYQQNSSDSHQPRCDNIQLFQFIADHITIITVGLENDSFTSLQVCFRLKMFLYVCVYLWNTQRDRLYGVLPHNYSLPPLYLWQGYRDLLAW